ncbi:hypothetical protein niasHS_006870 [Heterodera schachtii]|uniref:Uncharacterized protein n=1 Tax=Heterodera schachtii TaxID=97005 RepID=A0ABD2JFU5_HETSC
MAESVGIKRCEPLGLREGSVGSETVRLPPYDFVPVGGGCPPPIRPSDENVFLFYPNLLGYVRILLAFGALFAMSSEEKPWSAALLYFASALLDAFDGYLARKFNQNNTTKKIDVMTNAFK